MANVGQSGHKHAAISGLDERFHRFARRLGARKMDGVECIAERVSARLRRGASKSASAEGSEMSVYVPEARSRARHPLGRTVSA